MDLEHLPSIDIPDGLLDDASLAVILGTYAWVVACFWPHWNPVQNGMTSSHSLYIIGSEPLLNTHSQSFLFKVVHFSQSFILIVSYEYLVLKWSTSRSLWLWQYS